MMPLRESQKIIFDQAIDAIVNKGEKRIKIIGRAGRGKTVLIAALAEYFLTISGNRPVYCTAPTNKAVAVIMQKIQIDNPKLQFCTTHKACNVTQNINSKTGEVSFIANKYVPRVVDKYHVSRSFVLFVDESSMLNTDFVGGYKLNTKTGKTEYIAGYLEDFSFPIIFCGDSFQINPVGEDVSPIWDKNYPTFELTEVIRQGLGNPIIELSDDLDMIFFKKPKIVEDNLGFNFNNDQWDIISDLAEVNGTDELKYLAWTNKVIDAVNQTVREERYGEQVRKIEKAETIVFNEPFGSFYTNQEVKCQQVSLITSYISLPTIDTKHKNKEVLGRMDKLRIKYYRINDAFDIVHEDSIEISPSSPSF